MAVTRIGDNQATQSVSLTAEVAGTLPIGNGGTNATSAGAALSNLGGAADSAVVHNTGNETVAGTKTFSSHLILTGAAAPAYAQGKLVYDTDNECLTFFNNDSNVAMNLGQEDWVRVRNVTGSTIGNGVPVYISGVDTGLPSVALAKADAWNTAVAVGLTTESIANNATGYVAMTGLVRNVDTSAYSAGALLYVSSATAGALTATAPIWPNYVSVVGRVAVSNASTGVIHALQSQPIQALLGPTTVNAPGATPTVNWTLYNDISYTGVAANITSMTSGLTAGTPTRGQKLFLTFTSAAAQTISWGASYGSSGVATLPTTTVAGKTIMVGLRYDGSLWTCIAVDATGY